MKLENKFFKCFFYPFLISVILSSFLVVIFLATFTNKFDTRQTNQINNLEIEYSKIAINSINVMLKTSLQKIQLGLNELILYYQKMANKIINSSEKHEINTKFLKCILDFDDNYCDNITEESSFTAIWYLDQNTSENNINDISKKEIKNQLIAFSYLIPHIESIYSAAKPEVECYYFHFEKTDLFTSYPLSSDCEDGFFEIMKNYTIDSESYQCMDNEGKIYDYFKFKCEAYFISMLKSKTNAFDNNYLSNENRTIFITNYYGPTDEYLFR